MPSGLKEGIMFKPNQKFRRDYDRAFRNDPLTANMLLLLCELANVRGEVNTDASELAKLMAVRFDDSRAYQLLKRQKR